MPRRGCVERMPVARFPFDPDQKQERSQAAWRGRQPAERDTHPPPPKPRYHHCHFTLHFTPPLPPPPSPSSLIYFLYHHPHHPSLGLPVGPGSLQHSLPVAPHPQTPLLFVSPFSPRWLLCYTTCSHTTPPPPRLSLVERCWIAISARPNPLNPSFIALDRLHHLPAFPSELSSLTIPLNDFTKQDQATCAQLNPPPATPRGRFFVSAAAFARSRHVAYPFSEYTVTEGTLWLDHMPSTS